MPSDREIFPESLDRLASHNINTKMPAATIITTLPTFVTPEEHKTLAASTPVSFNDIPPKLYHKEDNVSVTLDPPLENFTSQDAAQGTLYVIGRYVK